MRTVEPNIQRTPGRPKAPSSSRVWLAAAAVVALAAADVASAQQVVPAGHRRQAQLSPSFAAPPMPGGQYAPGQFGPPQQAFSQPYCEGQPVIRRNVRTPGQDFEARPPLFPHAHLGGTTFRLEYRSYQFSDPGNVRVGAEQTRILPGGIYTPTSPAGQVSDFISGESYDLERYEYDNVNGIAGTLAVPLARGSLEFDGFATEQKSFDFFERTELQQIPLGVSSLEAISFVPRPVRPTIPLLSNGTPNSTTAIPLDTLTVSQSAEFFGAGAQWVLDPITPNVPLTTRPVVGARYIQYGEQFTINGQFVDEDDSPIIDPTAPTIPATVFNPRINSRAINHVFGPTVGLRFDTGGGRLTLGVEPKFGFGISRRVERVRAEDLPRAEPLTSDPTFTEEENEDADLSPFFELNAYSRLHLRENFSLFAGYNLFAMSRLSTASRQISYDSAGTDTLIGLEQDTRSVVIHGLMVGGEVTIGN